MIPENIDDQRALKFVQTILDELSDRYTAYISYAGGISTIMIPLEGHHEGLGTRLINGLLDREAKGTWPANYTYTVVRNDLSRMLSPGYPILFSNTRPPL